MTAAGLWSDDPDERRRRLTEALERARAREAEEAGWVVYLPASSWYVAPPIHQAAEWAAARAAEALGLGFTPTIKWFREGGPLDKVTDDPLAFRDRPGVAGFVVDGDPSTIWLTTKYCEPGAGVSPSLQQTIAHEAAHCRQQLDGMRGRTVARERLADLVAGWLIRGEPVPH